ncbi:MAG: hypothetical protein KGM42_00395 [Hyphomicrobiales bacterium]|nr:hypothetical protein [Hyphomicrobiales bacterium]
MLRWLRLVLSALALAGLLSAGEGGAFAAKAQDHHHCMSMMGDDCPGGDDHGAMPPCCVTPACPMLQGLLSPEAAVVSPISATLLALPLRDDEHSFGVRAPPDLRPPIA